MATKLSPYKADHINVDEVIQQDTLDASENLKVGVARIVTASGMAAQAKADTAPNAKAYGVICKKVAGNTASTVLRRGVVSGLDLTACTFGQAVYLDNDGDFNTDPGTNNVRVGQVIAMRGQLTGQPRRKALSVEL